jgi:hypothetical protein
MALDVITSRFRSPAQFKLIYGIGRKASFWHRTGPDFKLAWLGSRLVYRASLVLVSIFE